MIQPERIKPLNSKEIRNGSYVLYWMQASQRSEYNHALEYAILKANSLHKPLLVYFGLTEAYPAANERHFCFMLEGLRETQSSLAERGIKMVVWHISPEIGAVELSGDACILVVDKGYMRIQKSWVRQVAEHIDCQLVQVETNVVVPVEAASSKEEYSAATIRPRITERLRQFLIPLRRNNSRISSLHMNFDSLSIEDTASVVSSLGIDRDVKITKHYRGGTKEAKRLLENFLKEKLEYYHELRNDPTRDCLSNMSPYLHFGQISPLYIALLVSKSDASGKAAYLEELVVRRELSMNFVNYNENYDSFKGIPEWAKKSLIEHIKDQREYVYSLEELENAETHDPYWNAAQKEMKFKGKMHGYMRMYWGKKIMEWTETPEEAFRIALYLNDKYELDGRDPNGFAGVAWCFGKHDRPWKERKIFGKTRYMNASGLKRKFDAGKYVENVERSISV